MKQVLKTAYRSLVPHSVRRWVLRNTRLPAIGKVDWGELRVAEPVSRSWGGDRGSPIDRYYIERFLRTHEGDVRGRVLEVGGRKYTQQFGGGAISRSDVLLAPPGGPDATFVADLADAPSLPSATFDCFICTQTLQYVTDQAGAFETVHRILKPGGVFLATVPGIAPVDADGRWPDLWRFNVGACRWLLERAFRTASGVESCGNVLSATAFLQGIAAQELLPSELDRSDPRYQLLITMRAVKAPR